MFEHHKQPLLPRRKFIKRLVTFALIAVLLVSVSLFVGMLGYRYFEGMSWLDACLNASMILGGMGPVNPVITSGGKLFASAYALFSGVVFLISVGVFFAPVIHRLLHQFHIQTGQDE